MRNPLGMLFVVALATAASIQPASAQLWLFGLGAGYMIGSSNSQVVDRPIGAPTGEIYYVMPRAAERMRDPLSVSFMVIYCTSRDVHQTSPQLFTVRQCIDEQKKVVEHQELVRVVLIHSPVDLKNIRLQLAFTAKANLKDENELPPIPAPEQKK